MMKHLNHRLSALIALVFLASAVAVRANKATLNADGVLEIDGKKIFVIGFTAAPPPDGKTPSGKEAFAELADAGATFVRQGPEQPWNDEHFELEKKLEAAAARNGLHSWLNLREAAQVKPGNVKTEQMLRKILTTFRDNPGLGVYKGDDEPEWGKRPLPPLENAFKIIKEVDPNHPMAIIQAPRGTIASLRKYNSVSDITGMDVYPIGYPPGGHSQFVKTNSEISMVGDYTRIMMEVTEGKMPVWMTLQICWSGVIKEGKTLRFPTFPEERYMTYEAIINGARGINYFGGGLPKGLSDADAKLGWNWHFWNRVLRPVVEEIGTKSPLYPAPVSKQPVAVKGEGIEFCVREVGNQIFVLACKRGGATAEVQFEGLPDHATGGDVLFEDPRKVLLHNGRFTDWFGPYEVHVYRFDNSDKD